MEWKIRNDPFPQRETPRLMLREIILEDAKALYGYYSDRRVTKYLDWYGPRSMRHAKEIIKLWREQFRSHQILRWGIALKEEDLLIGTVLIMPCFGDFTTNPLPPMEMGYELSPDKWNQGIMTEALDSILQYCFVQMKAHRIQAKVFPENKASLRVLEKLGFSEEGTMRKHLYHSGTMTFNDVALLSLLKEEYSPRRG